MKRILILSNSSEGIYNFRRELVQEMTRTDKLFVSVPDTVAAEDLRLEGCEILPIKMNRRGINPLQDLKLMASYAGLIRRLKPDVILTYTIKPNLYGGLMAGFLGVPFIPTITGLGTAFQKQGAVQTIVKALYRRAFSKARVVFFQNARNRDLFQEMGLIHNRSRVVSGSGVNPERFREEAFSPKERPLFLFVGRLMKEKGIEEFLETAVAYAARADFAIVGDYEEDWKKQVEEGIRLACEAGERENVLCYHGPQRDVRPYYRQADAVIVASYHEGMSNVILEAAATGRPVLATNIPGCREAVEDNRTGLLFSPQSSQSLKDAVEAFLALPKESREAMGHAGRMKMEREFDRNRIVNDYLEEINLAVTQQK